MPITEREPICGFCWTKGYRQPLDFEFRKRHWRCPICEAVVYNPKDAEEIEAEKPLLAPDSDPHRHELTIASTLRIKGSGNNTTGKAKKVKGDKMSEALGHLKE